MTNLQFVIFDMDGLLFDTERMYFKAFQRAAKKLNYDFTFDVYLKVVGTTDETGKQILSEIYGEDAPILKAMDHYHDEFQQIIKEEGIAVKPGVEALLDVLDEKGIMKCIASSSSLEDILRNTKMAGIENRFDFFVSGTEVENGKPSPDIFLEAIRRANVKPEEALVLEDSYYGLQAASHANIRCILIPDLLEPTDEMYNLAYRVCSDLNEVADWVNRS